MDDQQPREHHHKHYTAHIGIAIGVLLLASAYGYRGMIWPAPSQPIDAEIVEGASAEPAPEPLTIDKEAYDAKMLQLANLPDEKEVPTAEEPSVDGETSGSTQDDVDVTPSGDTTSG